MPYTSTFNDVQDDLNQQAWNKIKNQLSTLKSGAVVSIQSIDNRKIALDTNEVAVYPELSQVGSGHTAFALAKTLQFPLGVLRSSKNNEQFIEKISQNVEPDGLLVITGHGSTATDVVSGNYIEEQQQTTGQDIKRSPEAIVDAILEGKKLKAGDHINIMLCICYGAKTLLGDDSFAHKFGRAFAKHDIKTTILASDEPVTRFGSEAVIDGKIIFHKIGIHKSDLTVLTNNTQPDATQVHVFKPYEMIALSSKSVVTSELTLSDMVKINSLPSGLFKGLNIQSTDYEVGNVKHGTFALKLSKQHPDALMFIYKIDNSVQELLFNRAEWTHIKGLVSLKDAVLKQVDADDFDEVKALFPTKKRNNNLAKKTVTENHSPVLSVQSVKEEEKQTESQSIVLPVESSNTIKVQNEMIAQKGCVTTSMVSQVNSTQSDINRKETNWLQDLLFAIARTHSLENLQQTVVKLKKSEAYIELTKSEKPKSRVAKLMPDIFKPAEESPAERVKQAFKAAIKAQEELLKNNSSHSRGYKK